MKYGLIGEHLPHSFSKEIHESLGRYEYGIWEIAPDDLDRFMTERDFDGINVTIPYKQKVIPYLSGISESARSISAVNTIVNKNGLLYGDNTDLGGMTSMIKRAGIEVNGKKVLILGTGGTSRTAFAAASGLGAREILKVSRDPEKGITYEEACSAHSDTEIIINTTPVGMFPKSGSTPVDITAFPDLQGYADVIYNPLRTKAALTAASKGIPACCGLYMLVKQAVLAAELFTGDKFDEEVTEKIFADILGAKQNLVLTGMPHSGKTTIGKLIAAETGMELIDTDELIIERTGMTPSEIFAASGEEHFRDIESEVISDISGRNGVIISTGGGAVLRDANVTNLKMNGIMVFLDRDPEQLIPTADRPTADSKEKIISLYERRLPVYTDSSDYRVSVRGTEKEVAEKVLSAFRQLM